MPSRLSRLAGRLSGTPRLILAALLLAVGAVSAVASAAPQPSDTVVVTTRALTPGASVTTADVRAVQRVSSDRPSGALSDLAAAVGHRVVGAVEEGEVITSARLAPSGFASGLLPGRSAVAVSVSPSLLAAITVGDLVDVVINGNNPSGSTSFDDESGSDPSATVDLTESSRVMAIWPAPDDRENYGATVVLDVSQQEARRLAVIPAHTLVGVVAVGP